MITAQQFDWAVPALIFKIGHYPLHHGTAGIVRSLGRMKVPVYAIVESKFAPITASRYLAGSFEWPTASLDRDRLFEGLASIARKLARRALLIPTDDFAAAFVAENSAALQKWFLAPRIDPHLPRRLANKRELYSICREHSIPCPKTEFPVTAAEVHDFIQRAVFPVVVKAAESQRTPPGMRSTSIARTPADLLSIWAKGAPGLSFIVQEYIPESCAEDWIYHGYANFEAGLVVSFTGRKLRSYPVFAGPTTLGVSERNSELERQTERLLRAIGYTGIVDLDYRFDRRDGQYKLLDFNPRIGANFRMFENQEGVDVVRALHLDLSGRPIPTAPAVERRVFVVESYDFYAVPGYIRRGALTWIQWWRSLQGKREFAWFSLDDPLPFPAMFVRLLWRAVRRLFPVRAANPRADGSLPQEKAVAATAVSKGSPRP